MPKQQSIDGKTNKIKNKHETNVEYVRLDVSDRSLKMPDLKLDVSEKIGIWSKVRHQNQTNVG